MHVLTTKWVDGERLVDSDADDVPRLCGIALNAYLTMLLDTGTLHCDPHPGRIIHYILHTSLHHNPANVLTSS